MKVKDLIEHLKQFDGEREIYLASDAEGNSFHAIETTGDYAAEGGQLVLFPEHDCIDEDVIFGVQ